MPMRSDRRDDDRIPLQLFLNTYVAERPHRAVTTNLSTTGLYLSRVSTPTRQLLFGREDRFVQIELSLPGTSDTIWARGEVRYDELGGGMVHGTGVYLKDIARGHQRLLREFVIEHRRQRLTQILLLIRKNRYQ